MLSCTRSSLRTTFIRFIAPRPLCRSFRSSLHVHFYNPQQLTEMSDRLDVSEVDDITSFVRSMATKSDLTTLEGNRMLQLLSSIELKGEETQMLFNQMLALSKANIYTFNIYITYLARACEIDSILRTMQQMQQNNVSPDSFTYNSLIYGYCKADQHTKAANVLKKMRKKNVKPDLVSFSTQISSLCKANLPNKALKLLQKMHREYDIQPELTLFNNVIDSFCKIRMADKAIKLFDEMVKTNIKPDAITFTTIIDTLTKSKQFEKATTFMEKMKECDVKLDLVSIDIMMNAFYAAGQFDKAVTLYKEMNIKYHLSPGYCTFITLIKHATKKGDETLIFSLLDDMKRSRKNPSEAISPVLCFFAKNGENNTALKLWNVLKEKKIIPSIVAFNSLIYSLYKSNQSGEVSSILSDMKELGVNPDIVTVNTMFQHNTPDPADAMKVLIQMKENNITPDEYTYGAVVHSLCKSKRHNEAIAWMEALQKELNVVPTVYIMTSILTSLCKAGELERAFNMYKDMKNQVNKPNCYTYNVLINAFSKKASFNIVTALLKDMEDANIQPDIVTYCTLISSYCAAKDRKSALSYMNMMKQRGIQGNDVYREIIKRYRLRLEK